MNQRIRELAKQSYKEVIETNDYNGDAYTVREFDQEKFAELIVQKCADIGEQYADGNYEVPNQILEYFGMQEPEE